MRMRAEIAKVLFVERLAARPTEQSAAVKLGFFRWRIRHDLAAIIAQADIRNNLVHAADNAGFLSRFFKLVSRSRHAKQIDGAAIRLDIEIIRLDA